MNEETTTPSVLVKKTKGQLFKEKNGYSLTRSKLLKKHGLTMDEYRAKLKVARKDASKLAKAKHDAAKANRGSKTTKK